MRDFTLALRTLARSPMVSVLVVLSLGLGIGGNTAVFSLLNQVLLQSLPVQQPEQVVFLSCPSDFKSGRSSSNDAGGRDAIFSYRMFRGLERNPQGLASLAAFRLLRTNLAFEGRAEMGQSLLVSGNYFDLLGLRPSLGRVLEPADDTGAGRTVVVLGHDYWQAHLGADPNVLNRVIRINGQSFTVVGVLQPGFQGLTLGSNPSLYLPLTHYRALESSPRDPQRWNDYWLYLVGRLKTGESLAQATAQLQNAFRPLVLEQAATITGQTPEYLERFRNQQIILTDGRIGRSGVRDDLRTPLLLLLGVAVLVLLIASANAANLMLARGAGRQKELSIRVALGASRSAIVRQLLSEALLLALAGGLAGLLIGSWTIQLFLAAYSDDPASPAILSTQLDPLLLAFTLALSLVTGLLFGIYPAWAAARDSTAVTLKDESSQTTGNRARTRVRRILVCGQVSASLVLLLPLGLFLKSLVNLSQVDLGMETSRMVTFSISPELNSYKPDQAKRFIQTVEEKLATIPGVRRVTAAGVPVLANNNWANDIFVEGLDANKANQANSMLNMVGPGFFSAFGTPLVAGREFTERDSETAPKVAVVNETFVQYFFGNVNPIGRKFGLKSAKSVADIEIVGVVRNTKYSSPRNGETKLFYTPYRQTERLGFMTYYLRTALPEDQVITQARRIMTELDPNLPLENVRTLEEQIAHTLHSDRLVVKLASAFAALALLLAMMGLYGVLAYNVSRRTREFGIRMALGAEASRIRRMVLRDVAIVFTIGVIIGLPAAYALGRTAESQLFGVKAYDVTVALLAILALGAAAFAAGYLPALRASRLNPTQALRHE